MDVEQRPTGPAPADGVAMSDGRRFVPADPQPPPAPRRIAHSSDFRPYAAEVVDDILAIAAEAQRNRPRALTGHVLRGDDGEQHVAERPR